MSDDVKVKFSGDFSDIPKGADAAVKNAGSAMSGYFKDLGSSLIGSLGGMFAAGAVIGKVFEQFQAAGEYFKELIHLVHTTGASAVELQQLGYVGKVVGVSFETIGKSLGLFSKYMGNASKDVGTHGKLLRELGFQNEQITNGTISSTDVLGALADQLEQTGNAYLVAANATAIFGRAGRELMPIIHQGKDRIKELKEETKTYTEGEISVMEASERIKAARKASIFKVFKDAYVSWRDESKGLTGAAYHEAMEFARAKAQETGKTVEEVKQTPEYQEKLIKSLKNKGFNLAWIKENFGETAGNEERIPSSESFEKLIQKKISDETLKKENNVPGSGGSAALASSSLQAIGGGDIASIYTGASIQQAQLDAANQTAANTGILAAGAKEPQKQSKPANVAK